MSDFQKVSKVESQPLLFQQHWSVEPDWNHILTHSAPKWNSAQETEFIRTENRFHSVIYVLSNLL